MPVTNPEKILIVLCKANWSLSDSIRATNDIYNDIISLDNPLSYNSFLKEASEGRYFWIENESVVHNKVLDIGEAKYGADVIRAALEQLPKDYISSFDRYLVLCGRGVNMSNPRPMAGMINLKIHGDIVRPTAVSLMENGKYSLIFDNTRAIFNWITLHEVCHTLHPESINHGGCMTCWDENNKKVTYSDNFIVEPTHGSSNPHIVSSNPKLPTYHQLERLGWIKPGDEFVVDQEGDYEIKLGPLHGHREDDEFRAIVIREGDREFSLSMRGNEGFDNYLWVNYNSGIQSFGKYTQLNLEGPLLHIKNNGIELVGHGYPESYLLDCSPEDQAGGEGWRNTSLKENKILVLPSGTMIHIKNPEVGRCTVVIKAVNIEFNPDVNRSGSINIDDIVYVQNRMSPKGPYTIDDILAVIQSMN